MGFIYCITNKINNKKYIGQTKRTVEERWKQHLYCYERLNSNNYLYNAMKKHGVENFTIEELEECPNEKLNEREKYWILIKNSYYINEKGYNLTYGGEGAIKYSDDQILSLWNKGYTGKDIAIELGSNISVICQRLNKLVGKEKIQERKIEKISKPVIQYNLYGDFIKEWDSASKAEKELNISSGSITKCCKKERVTSFNSLWKYKDDINTSIEDLKIKYAKSVSCNDVYLIDENNNIIEYFETAGKAEKKYNLTRGKVSEICWHKYGRKTVKGMKFEWAYPLKRELANGNK